MVRPGWNSGLWTPSPARSPHSRGAICGALGSGAQVMVVTALAQLSSLSEPLAPELGSRPPRRPHPVPATPARGLASRAARPHRPALEVVVEGLVQQVLLAAARGAHEAEVDVVVGTREPLAAGGHGDGVGGHGGAQRGPRGAGAASTGSLGAPVRGPPPLAHPARQLPASERPRPLPPPPPPARPAPGPALPEL